MPRTLFALLFALTIAVSAAAQAPATATSTSATTNTIVTDADSHETREAFDSRKRWPSFRPAVGPMAAMTPAASTLTPAPSAATSSASRH